MTSGNINIIIFGASGETGHELVRRALQKGFDVTAFVRSPARLSIRHSRLRIVQGDVKDYNSVHRAMDARYDAVLIALGAKTPFKRNTVLIDGVQHIVNSMMETGVRRIIYLSFAGVAASQKRLPFLFRIAAVPLLAKSIADHEEKERIIIQSNLEWIIVRPVLLSNGAHRRNILAGEDLKANLANLILSRSDVADFMLMEVTDNTFISKAPVLLRG